MTIELQPVPKIDIEWEPELRERLGRLTLTEKVRLLTGGDFWSVRAEPAIGLRRMLLSDGPAGVRGEDWDDRDPAANIPSPTALAASWDEELVESLGRLLASEARRKGADLLMTPTINLQRSPYAGRHFEYFSEDPLLTGRTAAALVRGLQSGGVGAVAKHFVANDSEAERRTLDARIDPRTLHELYLAPFEALVSDAAPWAMIAAYNSVNGHPMTESPLLRDLLKDRWGYDGVVVSDWFATRSTEAAGGAALDLAMPGPAGPWGEALVAAVEAGRVDRDAIDDKVLRLLRLAARVGALDGLPAARGTRHHPAEEISATVREAAVAGFVLARNDGVLPAGAERLRRVAVLGPNAATGRYLGGGSATVFPPYTVSPLAGLRAALGDGVRVDHAAGVRAFTRVPAARAPWLRRCDQDGPGLEVRFVAADGTVLRTEYRTTGQFIWLGGFGDGLTAADVREVQVHTRVRATVAGDYTVGAAGIGRYRLTVGGADAVDELLHLPAGADDAEGIMAPPQAVCPLPLAAGAEVSVRLVHDVRTSLDVGTAFQLLLEPPHGTDDEELDRAVALARDADLAVVVVGTTEEVESEGFDRTSLGLPGRQDELVHRVAAVNDRTVVVVNSGAPVLLPWADEVAAVLLAWFPGMEFGNALADVLLGRAEPGGRLPTSWPETADGLPGTRPGNGVLDYAEGLAVGYRADRRYRFPFGHGLGYSTWRYGGIVAPPRTRAGDDVTVRVPVRNTGDRPGREVVQIYLSRPGSAVPRRWLAGFAGVRLPAGGSATVEVTVAARAFAHWCTRIDDWHIEPGVFELHAGSSSADLQCTTVIDVHQ